jgi:tetratricopeptide (TPR) repeat protein
MNRRAEHPSQVEPPADEIGRVCKGPAEYLFDDEPLDWILYGDSVTERNCSGPTRANLYFTAVSCVAEMERLIQAGHDQEAVDRAAEIGCADTPLPEGASHALLTMIDGLFPNCPKPAVRVSVGGLGLLLEKLWHEALERKNEELIVKSGTKLSYWYEYQDRFNDARRVVTHLLEHYRSTGQSSDEAGMMNHCGFIYLLEKRWIDAIPYFEKATGLFEECGDRLNYANARANYWTCVVEGRLSDIADKDIDEMKTLAQLLEVASSWQKRKPLICLANIEERRGNLEEAVRLVERAIALADTGETTYPDEDRLYLDELMRKHAPDRLIL